MLTAPTHGDLLQSAAGKEVQSVRVSQMVKENLTCHNTRAQGTPRVDIGDAGVYVHRDGYAIFCKYLPQLHPCNFARFHVGVWYEVSIGPIRARPAKAKTLFFGCPRLDENVALSRDLCFDSSTERLLNTRWESAVGLKADEPTVMVSHSSAWTS